MMKVQFKTTERKIFSLDVGDHETVGDLKTRLEDDLGKDNMFRLIYSGKIMKDEECIYKYKIDPKRFVVVMVTNSINKSKDAIAEKKLEEEREKIAQLGKKIGDLKLQLEQEKDTPKDVVDDEEIPDIDVSSFLEDHSRSKEDRAETINHIEDIDEEEERRKIQELKQRLQYLTSTFDENKDDEEELEDEDTLNSEDDNYSSTSSSSYFVSQTTLQETTTPRERFIIEPTSGYITDREFTIALDVIMSMEYYTLQVESAETLPDRERVNELVDNFFLANDDVPKVNDLVKEKIEEVLEAKPSSRQLEAFLQDLCSIYCQDRSLEEDDQRRIPTMAEEQEEEEILDINKDSFTTNLSQLVSMGFLQDEAEYALRIAYNQPCMAVHYLVSGAPPSAYPPEQDNPLAFLRTVPEFHNIKTLVQANPGSLQSLLLSFGQQYPELMENINRNKEIFVRMLHEPVGARGLADDQGLVVDWKQDR